ncbi:RecF/RecN/SMC N-terminal domain protein, partial [Bordetella pertussis STO1-CHOC-0017]
WPARTSSRRRKPNWPPWKGACPRPTPSAAAPRPPPSRMPRAWPASRPAWRRWSSCRRTSRSRARWNRGWPSTSWPAWAACGRSCISSRAGKPPWKPRCASAWPRSRCAAWTGRAPSPTTRRRPAWRSTRCRSPRPRRPPRRARRRWPACCGSPTPTCARCSTSGLAGLYTAADLTQALGGRASLPAGAAYVVKAGHLVDAHSVRFYAPDSEQAGLLARQQEIENLQREIKAQQLIADQARAAVARAEAAWQQVSQAIAPARQRVVEVTRRVHDIQLEHSRLQQQAEQSGERAARLRQDLEELAAHEEDLRATREEAEVRFEALDGELAEHQSRFSDAEIDGETLSAQADAARTRLRELERAAQEAEFAERGVQVRITDLQRNRQLAADQSQRAATELQQLETDLVDLDASASQAGLQDALELRAEREEALTRARLELDNLSALMRGADEERMQQERGLEPLRARITELQLQEQAARLAEEQFTEQLNAREVDRETLARELAEMPDEWRKASWLQSEVGRISRQVDALGPVNLAALDELNTSRERKTFLDAQQQDLLTAMETLEDAIRKIDRETRELLQETFNTVNRHFGELFPKLFGGGEARLTMTGDEILDAGVQVMAQPPGKRNSTIHLLSGGEKALTATALVFALFKLNPAPFCLLDEVDAPLDDANTERYANLVSNMSEQTQFLFISHNKIAMQMAKQLIGVTMQEQGVSRIVAVDIDSAVQMAAEA